MPSACVVRRSLKWGNMRNPYPVLYVSRETAALYAEEGEDDVKSAWPFDALGDTHATMVRTEGCQAARRSQSLKTCPSSDWSLKPDSMKSESLVIADQNAAVNTLSSPVLTARQCKGAGRT